MLTLSGVEGSELSVGSEKLCVILLVIPVVYKVITTTVIRPLDDLTWCTQSVVANLRPLSLGYVRIGMTSFGSPPMYA